jgi:hypothetical protein
MNQGWGTGPEGQGFGPQGGPYDPEGQRPEGRGAADGGYGAPGAGHHAYGADGAHAGEGSAYGPAGGYGPQGAGPSPYGPGQGQGGPYDPAGAPYGGGGYGPPQDGWAGYGDGGPDDGREVLEGTVIPSPARRSMPPLYQSRSPQDGPDQQQGAQPAAQEGGSQAAPQAPGSLSRNPGEPDWDALATANEGRARRRRLFMIGGGVLAAAAVAAIVVVAVAKTGGSGKPAAKDRPTSADTANPKFPDVTQPPPPDPLDYISTAGKDTAPLTAETLFIGKRMSIGPRAYTKAVTRDTGDCASVTQGGLGSVLTSNGCRGVLRATYVREGRAVTVGVAVFDTAAEAKRALGQATGNIAAMPGGPVGTFCRPVACWRTSNAVGRYAYFTIAGPANGKPAQSGDTISKQAGRDAGTFAFNRIVQRGRDAAAR